MVRRWGYIGESGCGREMLGFVGRVVGVEFERWGVVFMVRVDVEREEMVGLRFLDIILYQIVLGGASLRFETSDYMA